MLRTAAVVALVAIASPSSARAQLLELPPGSHVRVTTVYGKITGTFNSVFRDSVEVTEPDGAVRRVDLSRVRRVDVSEGRSASAGAQRGFRLGALLGAILGAVYFGATELTDSFIEPVGSPKGSIDFPKIAGGALVGGIVGALVGGFTGSRRKAEVWRQVYPPPATQD